MEDQHSGQRGAHDSNHASACNTIAAQTKINMAAVYPFEVAQHTPKSSHAPRKVDDNHPSDRQIRICGFITLLAFATFVYTGIFLDQYYLPRPPIFHLHSLSISFNGNVTAASHITTVISWNATFNVRNPNRFGKIFHEEAINASVFYKDTNLSATISPFYQLGKDERSLDVVSVAKNDILVADWSKNGGVMNFIVTIDDIVLLSTKQYPEKRLNMRFTCNNVNVVFPSDNTTTTTTAGISMFGGHPKKCKIQYSKELEYHST